MLANLMIGLMEITLDGTLKVNLGDGNASLTISEDSIYIVLRAHGLKGPAPKVQVDWHTGTDVKGLSLIPQSSRSGKWMKGANGYALKFSQH